MGVLAPERRLRTIFLGGQRLDPKTDPRPDVRENVQILGDLIKDFDFNQKPRALLLPTKPKTDLVEPNGKPKA